MPYSKFVKLINSKKISYCDNHRTNKINENFEAEKKNLTLNDLDLLICNLFKQKKLYFSFADFIGTFENLCEEIYQSYEEKPKEFLIKFTKEYLLIKEESINDDDTYTIRDGGNNNGNLSIDLREDLISRKNEFENPKFPVIQEKHKIKFMENFILEFTLDIKIKIILASILETLVKLYKTYFHFEVNNYANREKIEKNSFNALIKFCSDFDLIPYTFSFEQISNYWNLVLKSEKIKSFLAAQKTKLFTIEDTNDPDLLRFNAKSISLNPVDLGFVFCFYNFSFFLIHISELAEEKQKSYLNKYLNFKNNNNSNSKRDKADKANNKGTDAQVNFDSHKSEKFLFLLEKLNRSNGFVKFEEKICLAFNAKYSLLPPLKVINLIIPSLIYYEMLESERAKHIQEIKNSRNKKTQKANLILNNSKLIDRLKASSNNGSNCLINENEIEHCNELESLEISSLIPVNEKIAKKIKLKLSEIKEIFDFYSLKFNRFVPKNKNKMIYIAFFKFLEDNDLVIVNENNTKENFFFDNNNNNQTYQNKEFEISTKELNNAFITKTPSTIRSLKENKLNAQDALNIFSELISIKNVNHTNTTTKNLITEASSKKDCERTNGEKELKIKNEIKFATIDFPLFLKSFEFLSLKLFFNKSIIDGLSDNSVDYIELLSKSIDKFISLKIPSIIMNYNLKKLLLEKSIDKSEIKQRNLEFVYKEKIVNYFFIKLVYLLKSKF